MYLSSYFPSSYFSPAFFAPVIDEETPPEEGGVSLTPEQAAAIALIPNLLALIEALIARFEPLPPGPVAVIPAPADPAQTMAHGLTRDASGSPEGGIAVQIQLTSPNASGIYERDLIVTSSSDSNTLGQIIVPLLKVASYRGRRGTGSWKFFTTSEEDTFELPIFLGA
jgi:hypothetical protein